MCESHSVPKSFFPVWCVFRDWCFWIEFYYVSRGLEYDSEVSNQRRRFWSHSHYDSGTLESRTCYFSCDIVINKCLGFPWFSCLNKLLVPPFEFEPCHCIRIHSFQLILTWLNQISILLVLYRYYSWPSINFSGILFYMPRKTWLMASHKQSLQARFITTETEVYHVFVTYQVCVCGPSQEKLERYQFPHFQAGGHSISLGLCPTKLPVYGILDLINPAYLPE